MVQRHSTGLYKNGASVTGFKSRDLVRRFSSFNRSLGGVKSPNMRRKNP
jgi:hypothetical protein